MRVLLVHPSPLMYSEIYLRLEPLGLERVAAAVRAAGPRGAAPGSADLQARRLPRGRSTLRAAGRRLLAQLPRQRARGARPRQGDEAPPPPECFIFAGGHSVSFIAPEVLDHAAGALDCVVRGEGEVHHAAGARGDRRPEAREPARRGHPRTARGRARRCSRISTLPARARPQRAGAASTSSACSIPARRRSSRAAARGTARSAARGRSTAAATARRRRRPPPRIWRASREPNVFLVDDVAFIHPEHGFAIGQEIERRGIRKQYYLETRVRRAAARTRRCSRTGGGSACTTCSSASRRSTRKALQAAPQARHAERELQGAGGRAARSASPSPINIIADPDWDERRFAVDARVGAERCPRSCI